MIPFGIHCATISLISHDKVQSFVNDIGRPEWGVEMTEDRRGVCVGGSISGPTRKFFSNTILMPNYPSPPWSRLTETANTRLQLTLCSGR